MLQRKEVVECQQKGASCVVESEATLEATDCIYAGNVLEKKRGVLALKNTVKEKWH